MKQALAFSCAALLGCVPASEKLPPAGAAGFLTEPSSAARGEPVTTEDVWTVTFDKIVVQATVNVDPVEVHLSSFSYGGSSSWL